MQKVNFQRIILMCFCLVFSCFAFAENEKNLTERADVKAFMQMMVKKHHFDSAQLKSWLSKAKIQPAILTSIAKPAEKLTWERYQPIFITPKRIDEGVVFWQQNKTALAKAEKEYGVPAEVIVAIIGVETFYGKHAGQYSVLDSLVTLGFDYPPRSKFFLSELEEFLLLAREEKWDPTQIKGSYAGAMGKPQFIASSYRRYAIDFNKKGKRDLLNNVDDAIGSVANYFKVHGWKKDGPIAVPAKVKGPQFKDVVANSTNPKPERSLQQLSQMGISVGQGAGLDIKKSGALPFALIALEGKTGPEYWLGAQNFYVITRYNHSNLYAMAVYTLSEKIKTAYKNEKNA